MLFTYYVYAVGSDFSYSGPQAYTFDASTNVSIINIALVNDNVYELIETFQARLSFHGQQPERVRIDPGRTYATIFDDDGNFFLYNDLVHLVVAPWLRHNGWVASKFQTS